MAKSPMVEASIVVLEAAGKELAFNELFEKVVEELQLDKDVATKRIAKLYSDITLDKRFVSFPENKWDLKKRHRLDDIIEEPLDILIDDDYEDYEDLDIEVYDYDEDDEDEENDGLKLEEDEIEEEEDEQLDVDIFEPAEEVHYDEDVEEFKELAIASED